MQTPQPQNSSEPGSRHHRRKVLIQISIFCTVLIVIPFAAVGVSYISYSRNSSALESLPRLGQIPDFALVERSGQPIGQSDLNGRVWIADFIFTYCAGPCPRMTAEFIKLQREFKDTDRVRLVTFTVDPDRDTPQALRDYADRHGAHPTKWLFITGDLREVHRLVVEGFKLGSVEDPMMHSTRFVLVDADGAVRGYYDSEEPAAIDNMVRHARLLARLN